MCSFAWFTVQTKVVSSCTGLQCSLSLYIHPWATHFRTYLFLTVFWLAVSCKQRIWTVGGLGCSAYRLTILLGVISARWKEMFRPVSRCELLPPLNHLHICSWLIWASIIVMAHMCQKIRKSVIESEQYVSMSIYGAYVAYMWEFPFNWVIHYSCVIMAFQHRPECICSGLLLCFYLACLVFFFSHLLSSVFPLLSFMFCSQCMCSKWICNLWVICVQQWCPAANEAALLISKWMQHESLWAFWLMIGVFCAISALSPGA